MSCLFAEFNHLIFNRRTVTRSGTFNDAGINRGTVYVCANNLMGLFIRIGKIARHLLDLYIFRLRGIGKRNDVRITILCCHPGKINGSLVNSGGRTCFEASCMDSKSLERVFQICRSLHTARSGLRNGLSDKAARVQVGSGTDNDRLAVVDRAGVKADTGNLRNGFAVRV